QGCRQRAVRLADPEEPAQSHDAGGGLEGSAGGHRAQRNEFDQGFPHEAGPILGSALRRAVLPLARLERAAGAMRYGARVLRRGCRGPDVVELQIRLAGFRGTMPDGKFGSATERQVIAFQRDYMALRSPSGIASRATLRAIDRFAADYPIDFGSLRCPC